MKGIRSIVALMKTKYKTNELALSKGFCMCVIK